MNFKAKPNPGSDDAMKQGCTCARMDNAHGAGVPSKDGPLFWVSGDCPLHNPQKAVQP